MGKYDPLNRYLKSQPGTTVPMSFTEIERIIGFKLPPSAYRHRPWWSNNASNSVITNAWLEAGYRTEQVDMARKKLVFVRPITPPVPAGFGLSEEGRAFKHAEATVPRHHPLIGVLKGTFSIEASWDLTRPALDPEEQAEWDASLGGKADRVEAGLTDKSR